METSSLKESEPREERNDAAGKSNGSAGDCCFEIHGEVQGGCVTTPLACIDPRLPLSKVFNFSFLFLSFLFLSLPDERSCTSRSSYFFFPSPLYLNHDVQDMLH